LVDSKHCEPDGVQLSGWMRPLLSGNFPQLSVTLLSRPSALKTYFSAGVADTNSHTRLQVAAKLVIAQDPTIPLVSRGVIHVCKTAMFSVSINAHVTTFL
jgi:hypothetical protein